MKLIKYILVCCFLVIGSLSASELKSNLETILQKGYGDGYLKSYMQPFATALAGAVGSSLYYRGNTKAFPGFDIGINLVHVLLPTESKYFNASGYVDQSVSSKAPTVFGSRPSDQQAVSGLEMEDFQLPIVQINLGLLADVEASFRYSKTEISGVGDIELIGAGLKYGLYEFIFIPALPMDFSIQAMYHKFNSGSLMESGTFSMNFHTSVNIPSTPVDLFAGAGFDNSTLIINTNSFNIDDRLKTGNVSMENENAYHLNLGLSLNLWYLNLHSEYSFGKYSVISGGFFLSF